MNPCPCGNLGDPRKQCTCTPSAVSWYQKRLSGPLLDRIDIFTEVPSVEYEKLTAERSEEPSASVRQRVMAAREVQRARFGSTPLRSNADMGAGEVWGPLPVGRGGQRSRQGRHGTVAPVGQGLSSDAEARADHRRPGRRRADRPAPPGRGRPVPPANAGLGRDSLDTSVIPPNWSPGPCQRRVAEPLPFGRVRCQRCIYSSLSAIASTTLHVSQKERLPRTVPTALSVRAV